MSAKNTAETFWPRVRKGGVADCWNWQGAVTSSGYGSIAWRGSVVQAHRLAYYLHNGGIELQTGFRVAGVASQYDRFVLHKCDNRLCCNPAHLFLGTMRDNQLDAYSKNRREQPKSKHVNAKLSADQVRSIRDQYAAGRVTQQELAARYKVTQTVISMVVRRETYKDVE